MRIKKIMASVLSVLLLGIGMSVPVSAAETTPAPNFGDVDILINDELGLIIETRAVAINGRPIENSAELETDYSQTTDNTRAIPEQETSRTFTHNIYDRNHTNIATVYSTVRGVYSQVDSWAQILDISAYATGSNAVVSQITFNTSKSGSDGYLYIYFGGASSGTMHYKIYTNGTISNL
ncbi:hypothetical protein [Eisenbergiella massiliensis]|uniref:DUF5626 domain-containing protein n=1 Tax=Eisenbergiella massiliensis TaxID=1720294 RepID=A0A3E3I763_9FIRM|nr:hypothetical protein [Eisenbergiella massiliensis]RGE61833.1 hypothetical protein DXC51_09830 [Eisenbergiella massiliensis]